MFLLIPAWPRDSHAPPLTALLLILQVVIFLLTWPLELSRQHVVSADQYSEQARQLSRLLLEPDSQLKDEDRALIQSEQGKEGYPGAAALALFQRIDADPFALSAASRYRWQQDYPLFQSLERSRVLHPEATTPFQLFGLSPNHSWFPGLLTHMFLHAGWLHLIFNMLFFWTVGLVLEPVLGLAMPGLFLAGGAAAAVAQWGWGVPPAQTMVGASGAIAGLMGFALAALPRARVTLFYAHMIGLMPRGGTFESPLWFCIPLWALQQVFMLLMTAKSTVVNVGYAAHVGGFCFGVAAGAIYRFRRGKGL